MKPMYIIDAHNTQTYTVVLVCHMRQSVVFLLVVFYGIPEISSFR